MSATVKGADTVSISPLSGGGVARVYVQYCTLAEHGGTPGTWAPRVRSRQTVGCRALRGEIRTEGLRQSPISLVAPVEVGLLSSCGSCCGSAVAPCPLITRVRPSSFFDEDMLDSELDRGGGMQRVDDGCSTYSRFGGPPLRTSIVLPLRCGTRRCEGQDVW